jgi:hypothetical protein
MKKPKNSSAPVIFQCAVSGRFETLVRSFRVGPVQPFKQYNSAVCVSFVAPRKRQAKCVRILPDNIRYLTVEQEGETVYDSGQDVPCDIEEWTVTKDRFERDRAPVGYMGGRS